MGARRCVRRTRERTKVDATVSSMDVSLTCIERNRACTEQMPHVTRTESRVRGTGASRHANGIVHTGEPGGACADSTVAYPERKLASLGTYAHNGSDSNTSPVIDHARAREPPQRSRNSQRPHLPLRLRGSRSATNRSLVA